MSQKEVEKNSWKNTTLDDIRLSPDEEPIFVLRKKSIIKKYAFLAFIWFGFYLAVLALLCVIFHDNKKIFCFMIFLLCAYGFIEYLLEYLYKEIIFYKNGIYIYKLNIFRKKQYINIKYSDISHYSYVETHPFKYKDLYIMISVQRFPRKYMNLTKYRSLINLSSKQYKEADLEHCIEILESNGIKEEE